MEGVNDSAQINMLHINTVADNHGSQASNEKYFLSWREILNQRGGFRRDGKATAVEERSDGRGQSGSSTHLPGDCRVQITPQLLEIGVRRVFHLESLLVREKKRHSLKKKKQGEKSRWK